MSVASAASGVPCSPSKAVTGMPGCCSAISRTASSSSEDVPDRLMATTRSYGRKTGGTSLAIRTSVTPSPALSRISA